VLGLILIRINCIILELVEPNTILIEFRIGDIRWESPIQIENKLVMKITHKGRYEPYTSQYSVCIMARSTIKRLIRIGQLLLLPQFVEKSEKGGT